MNCVLIYRDLSDSEIQRIKELYTEGAAVFISSLQEIPQSLNKIKIGTIYLKEEVKKKLALALKDELLAYGNQVANNKSIKEWLTVYQTSLWYYHKHRIYLKTRNYLYTLNEIKNHSKDNNKTYVFTDQLFPEYDFKNTTFYYKKKSSKSLNTSEVINFSLSIIKRCFSGFLQRIKYTKRKHLIVRNRKSIGPYLNLQTLEENVDDVFLGYLLQKTDSSFLHIDDIVVLKPEFSSNQPIKKSSQNYPTLNAEYILFAGLFRIWNIIKLVKKHYQLKSIYQSLSESHVTSIENLITKQLIKLHKSSLFYLFKLLAFQSFFKNKNFNTITAKDENSSSSKIILDAAKYNNIKTIGIQHGAIGDLNINYLFTEEDKSFHPMPDYTLVWGDYWKEVLINTGFYPEKSVITIGQIRTDVIPKLKESNNRYIFSEQNNYNHTMVFASQPQPDLVLRKQSAEDVFKAVSKLKSTLLVIKMHPRENNPNYYNQIAKSIGFTHYIIENEMDLYKVIAGSDVMITCYSTVGGEAVFFDKPLVILDHLKLDYCGYYREGVAKQAINALELEKILTEMINNKFSVNADNYAEFKKNYAFKIDGNVSNRCLDFIKNSYNNSDI